jgi:hypothetical protein
MDVFGVHGRRRRAVRERGRILWCVVQARGCCVLCILTERRMDPLLLFSSPPPSNVPSANRAANISSIAVPVAASHLPRLPAAAISQNKEHKAKLKAS